MNPFYEDAKKKKAVSEDEDVDVESIDSDEQVKSKKKTYLVGFGINCLVERRRKVGRIAYFTL